VSPWVNPEDLRTDSVFEDSGSADMRGPQFDVWGGLARSLSAGDEPARHDVTSQALLLVFEYRSNLFPKLRTVGVSMNVGRVHRCCPNDLFFLTADGQSASTLTWHLSAVGNLATH
jgi:hypothetical protein